MGILLNYYSRKVKKLIQEEKIDELRYFLNSSCSTRMKLQLLPFYASRLEDLYYIFKGKPGTEVLLQYATEYSFSNDLISKIIGAIEKEDLRVKYTIEYARVFITLGYYTYITYGLKQEESFRKLLECNLFGPFITGIIKESNNVNLLDEYIDDYLINTWDRVLLINSMLCNDEDNYTKYFILYMDDFERSNRLNDYTEIVTKEENLAKIFKKFCEKRGIYYEIDYFIEELICNLDDFKPVIDYYKTLKNDEDRINFLSYVSVDKIKNELLDLNLISDYQLSLYLMSPNQVKELKKEIDLGTLENVDSKITIGVELEAVSEDTKMVCSLLTLGKLLNSWRVKRDASVRIDEEDSTGLEIISPILNYSEDSLKELYIMTDFMNTQGFTTNSTCGGHIHLGFDYFDTVQEFKAFTSLYGVIEDILYLISNRADTKIRQGTDRFARSNAEMISNLRIYIDNIVTKADLKAFIDRNIQDRYTGLNFTNIGKPKKNTIEFRMPNGEIDFFEVKANILLFCRLLEASKKLVHSDIEIKELYDSLFNEVNQDKRFEIMLKLLFPNENERSIYIERYRKNKLFTDSIPEHYNVKLYNVEIKGDRVEKVDTKKVKNFVSNFRTIRNTLNDEEIEQRNR